ncbi:MAG: hypothetical protein M1834_002711 [Cirrosporium novae-zelandiae]|nr:MAG: hypothetical protein M1834_002711 [Cirrosporium novae-zelandiae]
MAQEYSKKKVNELQELLKSRGLSHTGKKTELIERLEQHDKSQAASAAVAAPPPVEDEIDWEEDTEPAKATTEPAAAALAAGGQGQVANPTVVPNQQVDIDPSTTSDLQVTGVAVDALTATTEEVEKPAKVTTEDAKPPVDFSTGLAKSDLDTEIAKRKARAQRFGITETDSDALKTLERAKRFGTGTATTDEQAESSAGVRGLDEALPERKKRVREEDGGRDGKRRFQQRGGRGGRAGGGGGRRNPRYGGGNRVEKSASGRGGPSAFNSDKDRLAAEARKKRFAGPAAS